MVVHSTAVELWDYTYIITPDDINDGGDNILLYNQVVLIVVMNYL